MGRHEVCPYVPKVEGFIPVCRQNRARHKAPNSLIGGTRQGLTKLPSGTPAKRGIHQVPRGKRHSDARSAAGQQNLPLQDLFDGVAAVAAVDCDLDLQASVAGEE